MLRVLECSPVAHFAIGSDHRITFWNRACEDLTGMPAQEMVGTDRQWQPFYREPRAVLADLVIDNNFSQFLALYGGCSPARSEIVPSAWEATDFFAELGGKPRYVYFLAAPIVGEGGKVVGAVETLQDITEQKRWLFESEKESERLRQENQRLRSAVSARHRFGDIIGKSPAMQEVYDLILKAAATDNNVIIYGESGTGKELVAKAIHEMSDRRNRRLVTVNCGAIPENLLESEFFGYKKGAFTGAYRDKEGLLDLADGGTLFLDEVGEIPPNMQVKLLRAIEGGGYSPVGGSQVRKPDIRIVSATNKDLLGSMKKGLLREDFFYRIHIIPIHLPPLRERREDIRLLVDHFLTLYGVGRKTLPLPEELREMLTNYAWPGNVRELQNVLHRFVTLNKVVLPTREAQGERPGALSGGGQENGGAEKRSLREELEGFERNLILKVLTENQWRRTKAASLLGISRNTLFRKMRDFGLI